MFKIAYVTDLHLAKGPSRRLDILITKMRSVNKNVNAFFFGGDTFTLEKKHWEAIVKRQTTQAEIEERKAFSRESADYGMPLIMDAAGGIPVIMGRGNGDFLACEHLKQHLEKFPGLTLMEDQIHFIDRFSIIGVGGIAPGDEGDISIKKFNPWYGGIISEDERAKTFSSILETAKKMEHCIQENAILIAHQPALNYLDFAFKANRGSLSMLNFVQKLNPLVYLTGHIHWAPLENDIYSFSRAYVKMPWGTVCINPGGDYFHDIKEGEKKEPEGVKMALIDIGKLISGCNMQEAIQPVPLIIQQ